MKKAMTVLGSVEINRLGHVLPHEHILMKFPDFGAAPLYPELEDKKVALDILGKIRRDIWSCKDNLVLDDMDAAVSEVASYKSRGGGTIVDVTPLGLNRNVNAVKLIAEKTGVHIVAGTGYYVHAGHPREVGGLSVEDLTAWMIKEVQAGIGDTGVKAGIIGEIGISSPMHPDEEKVLRAAARARKETGAPLTVHQYGGSELGKIHKILTEEGVGPEGVILCHMCSVSGEQRLWAAEKGLLY